MRSRLPNYPAYEGVKDHRTYDQWLRGFRNNVLIQVNDIVQQGFVDAGILCHNYWRVEVGDICCRCKEEVYPKPSGISCRCGHRWFCW